MKCHMECVVVWKVNITALFECTCRKPDTQWKEVVMVVVVVVVGGKMTGQRKTFARNGR